MGVSSASFIYIPQYNCLDQQKFQFYPCWGRSRKQGSPRLTTSVRRLKFPGTPSRDHTVLYMWVYCGNDQTASHNFLKSGNVTKLSEPLFLLNISPEKQMLKHFNSIFNTIALLCLKVLIWSSTLSIVHFPN